MTGDRANAERLVRLLSPYRFRSREEKDVQRAIAQVLKIDSCPFEAEVDLAPGDRIDFLVQGGVGLEVKVQGTAGGVLRQLHRYAQSPRVNALVLLTTRAQVAQLLTPTLNGKPVLCIRACGGLT